MPAAVDPAITIITTHGNPSRLQLHIDSIIPVISAGLSILMKICAANSEIRMPSTLRSLSIVAAMELEDEEPGASCNLSARVRSDVQFRRIWCLY